MEGTTNIYTLKDFEEIVFNGFDLTLPEATTSLISSIAEEVGAPTYIRTPNFPKRDRPTNIINAAPHTKRRRNRNLEINDDDWETIRKFQATEVKKKEGIDKHIDAIRLYLNKISDKNYDAQSAKIFAEIDELISIDTDEETMMKVGHSIFTTASTNKFYSELYATLYKDLMSKFDIMKVIFDKNFNSFMDLFKVIEYVDPKDDYNMFCKVNKDNDERRAMSLFLINLMKKGIIEQDAIMNIILLLQGMVKDFILFENKLNQVEELAENIYIMTTSGYSVLVNHEDWDTVLNYINIVSNMKAKKLPSISSKAIFKHMDMLDEFN